MNLENKFIVLLKTKEISGITLIALVITIIVLLILAAVSVSTLTGDNGILTKASEAKNQTEIAQIKEMVQTDILEKQTENESGNISKQQLKEVLIKYFEDVPEPLPDNIDEIPELTAMEVYGGHEIKISDIWNGSFTEGESTQPTFDPTTLRIGEAINATKYGWKVTNYDVKTSEFTSGIWRLFYQDNQYTYLITDSALNFVESGGGVPSHYLSNYPNGNSVSGVGKALNSEIKALFTESNTSVAVRAVAWLTDTSESSMWSSYKNPDTVFAIGCPSAELFTKSYNASGLRSGFGANLRAKSNGYYFVDVTSGQETERLNTVFESGCYGIYSAAGWKSWLCSSYHDLGYYDSVANSGQHLLTANSISSSALVRWYVGNSAKIRPIVCIPTSTFQTKYESFLVGE